MAVQELRTDVLTGRQVIVAAGRDERPQQTPVPSQTPSKTAVDAYDPFLEGHENDTPNESLALRRQDSAANERGWLLRVVPNRYPAVTASQASATANPAVGIHEVIVECPDLRTRLSQLSAIEIARILLAWQHRFDRLSRSEDIAAVSIFRNEGNGAGASLRHSHSQVVATSFLSQQLQQRVQCAAEYHRDDSHQLFLSWLQSELQQDARVVSSESPFAIICPFASRVSWHTRLVPIGDTPPSFEKLTEPELIQLAGRLFAIVKAHEKINGTVDHNLNLILPPSGKPDLFPWMLDFLPRKNRFAGFEMMTDTDIVTTTPEDAAQQLQAAIDLSNVPTTSLIPEGYSWR